MKKILLIAVTVTSVLAISSCAKDRVEGCTDPFSINYNPNATDEDGSCFAPSSEKHALAGDFTGTWCPWCGEWGGPEFDKMIDASGTKVVPMGIHVTDEMTTAETAALDAYYTAENIVTGYPTLYVWNQSAFTDGTAGAASVDAEIASLTAEAGAIADFVDNGTSLTIQVSAKLFAEVTGDYFVAAYLMENGLIYPQEVESTGTVSDWVHNHVIRGSSNGSAWGEQWVFAAGQNGQAFNKSYSIEKHDDWNLDNMYCIAIVWKYDSATDKYTFVNVQSTEGQ